MDLNDNIIIKEEELFDGSCDLCLKDFPSYEALKKHKKLICNDCGHIVQGSRNLQLHIKNHKKSTCPDCKKVLFARNMAKHKCKPPKQNDAGKKKRKRVKRFICEKCGKAKDTKAKLDAHSKIHEKEKNPTNVTVVTISLPGLII